MRRWFLTECPHCNEDGVAPAFSGPGQPVLDEDAAVMLLGRRCPNCGSGPRHVWVVDESRLPLWARGLVERAKARGVMA